LVVGRLRVAPSVGSVLAFILFIVLVLFIFMILYRFRKLLDYFPFCETFFFFMSFEQNVWFKAVQEL